MTSEVASCAGVDWAVVYMVELVTDVGFQLPLGFIEVHKAITSMFAFALRERAVRVLCGNPVSKRGSNAVVNLALMHLY